MVELSTIERRIIAFTKCHEERKKKKKKKKKEQQKGYYATRV